VVSCVASIWTGKAGGGRVDETSKRGLNDASESQQSRDEFGGQGSSGYRVTVVLEAEVIGLLRVAGSMRSRCSEDV